MMFDIVSYIMGQAAGGGRFTPVEALSGNMTLNENGITWTSRKITGNRGFLKGTETAAGFEGFNIQLNNLTANKQYLLVFTWQTLEGEYFTREWMFGYKFSNSAVTTYDVPYNTAGWTEMTRDRNAHTYMLQVTPSGTTAYLVFAVPGFSDDTTNSFELTNVMVVDPTLL